MQESSTNAYVLELDETLADDFYSDKQTFSGSVGRRLELASDNLHDGVAGLIALSRCERPLMRNDGLGCCVETQDLPAARFVVANSAANLPGSHDGIVVYGKTDIVNLYETGISVIAKLEDMA